MTLILKQIFGLLKVLNSDTGSNQIASGIAFGLILGFIPALSLQTVFTFVLILIFRVQLGAVLISAFFFAFPAYLFDHTFNQLGSYILEMEGLRSLFTTLYAMPIIPYTRMFNSLVMGATAMAFMLFPLVFVIFRFLIIKYREKVVAKIKDTKLFKMLQATALYKWYHKYDQIYG
ncbi:MAG: TIGR03546 family protein [Bdellovibrionales bacterium]|jgi:uncharacterized protein (TIGR03546 family)|nr:TIGR03546 family protein [Bdellovibrionales bacterium]MBT3525892.1 TIGR03546 family protein [Bdellovibrionales bacterium]MBT7670076.1 TIGR03546 family protein [Bdellovibrionales bacterium]MBT7765910.1 TIGR03546 family protein [Bdellovibrionales bacterium]